jgi:hypothetical protein
MSGLTLLSMRCGASSSPHLLVQRWHLRHDLDIDKKVDEIPVIVQTSWQVDLRFLAEFSIFYPYAVC